MFALVVALLFGGCTSSVQEPNFPRASRDRLAGSLDEVENVLQYLLDWVPQSICEIARCPDGAFESCVGNERQAARVRYVWLSCLNDPVDAAPVSAAETKLDAGAEPETGAEAVEGDVAAGEVASEPNERVSADLKEAAPVLDFVDCVPEQGEQYREMMESASRPHARWLRDQLILVDEVRLRLRAELPADLQQLTDRLADIDVEINEVRARYQREMEALRRSSAPSDFIGTWEDRYQTAMDDLSAIERRLDRLRTDVVAATDFRRRRFADAASRIAASGYESWDVSRCERE